MSGNPRSAAEPASSAARPLLANCPYCEYALDGLPAEHTCPECGQRVNRAWNLFGGERCRRRYRAWMKRVMIVLVTIWVPLAAVLGDTAGAVFLLFCALQMVAFTAVCLWLLVGNGSFAVVEPDGLLVGNPRSRKITHHKWHYVSTKSLLLPPIPLASTPQLVLVNNLPLWRLGILNQIACARAIRRQKSESTRYAVAAKSSHDSRGSSA